MTEHNIIQGDCIEQMRLMEDNSIDAIVTDPPYELGFMGKSWDSTGIAFNVEVWAECLRVLKPGGHLLAFSGSRTYHRMAVAIEDAGFEIRDQIMWIYGSGFPKSLDVSKAIDKKPETLNTTKFKMWLAEQIEKCGKTRKQVDDECGFTACSYSKTDGKDGWSSNHPSLEKWAKMKEVIGLSDEWDWVITDNIEQRGFIETTGGLHGGTGNTVGRYQSKNAGKQLSDNAISQEAKQWQGWGTALKPAHEPIVLARKPLIGTVAANVLTYGTGGLNIDGARVGSEGGSTRGDKPSTHLSPSGAFNTGHDIVQLNAGRWPSNVIHDGSDEVVDYFGEPQRFFYCAKASKRDRNEGLDGFEVKKMGRNQSSLDGGVMLTGSGNPRSNEQRNHHPTVKPTDLMRYLCRLITPPNGVVLDPFMGSGSTGKASIFEGFRFVGIEQNVEYVEIAKARIEFARKKAND
jgi:DNA modification methylase